MKVVPGLYMSADNAGQTISICARSSDTAFHKQDPIY